MNGMTSFGRTPMRKSMSMPMAPPAARLRHRKSLQEDEHSKSFSFSFAKRRVERQSSLASTPQGVEVALLDRVQVEFVKAVLPANKMASTRYVMRVASAAMNQSWEMSRTFREFYELKEDIVRALDHGHFCKSNCPWVYMYVTHHFPRRHVFRSRSPSVISNRISELQTFMSTVLGMWKENRSLECGVSGSRLPHLLYEFLFQGMVLDFGDINNFAAANGVDRGSLGASSIGGSFLDNGGARVSDEECSICQRSLVTPDTSISIAPPSSSNKENSSRSNASNASSSEDTCESYSTAETIRSSEQIMTSLTTLQCGHCFHDECILAKLNESLVCPRCAVPAAH